MKIFHSPASQQPALAQKLLMFIPSAPKISLTQMMCSNQWKDRWWGPYSTHPWKLHHLIAKKSEITYPRHNPENVLVNVPTQTRASVSTGTRPLPLMLSLKFLYFRLTFSFLLKKIFFFFLLEQGAMQILAFHWKAVLLLP